MPFDDGERNRVRRLRAREMSVSFCWSAQCVLCVAIGCVGGEPDVADSLAVCSTAMCTHIRRENMYRTEHSTEYSMYSTAQDSMR